MSFLAPLFLIGGLAIALPVVFHLIRRTTKERTNFSSLMFLQPTPPKLTRRSRLEHLLLLALRCLALILLAVGFGRPLLKHAVLNEPKSASARKIIVLVDASASMRRANLWADAREKADSVLRQTSPGDQAAVFTFDRQLHTLMSFEQWNAAPVGERASLAGGRLMESGPGWGSAHLGNALTSAAEGLAEQDGKSVMGPRQIVLISDLKEGNRLDQLQGYEWPKGIEVTIEQVRAKHCGNAGLQLVTDSDETGMQAATNATVRVRVSNAADSQREQFKVGWASADGTAFAGEAMDVYVPPGQSRIVSVAVPAKGVVAERIRLQGDEEDYDNTVFVIPPETGRLNVVYVGNDSGNDSKQPLYFLKRAFEETRKQSVQVVVSPARAPLSGGMQGATLLVSADALSEATGRMLREQASGGKTVLIALTNEAAAHGLAGLLQVGSIELEEKTNNYVMLAEIDFQHPLFAPFADARFSDFTRIHFWKYRRLDAGAIPNTRVVARFDSGDPAVLEVPIGKGRAIIWTSGWQLSDSQLALSTKFVPLLYATLDYSGAALPKPAQYVVGDAVPVGGDVKPGSGASASAKISVQTPDGSRVDLVNDGRTFGQTATPGIYTVSADAPKRFAVNLDSAESRTAPLTVDELERLGVPMARQRPSVAREQEREVRLQTDELEARQKLWRWFIVATIAVLLMETWLAGRTARRVAQS
jgi:hypothetical protein